MKSALAVALMCSLVLSARAYQQNKPGAEQVAIDKLRTEMKEPAARMAALDEADRRLGISDQAQTDTMELLRRSERRVVEEDRPRWKTRLEAFLVRKRQHIASGCPWEFATLPPAEADRCNRAIIPLNAEVAALNKEDARLNAMEADIANTRAAVTQTTLANWKQRKANYALRDALEAQKAAQEAQLRKLYLTGITEAVRRLELRDKASQACGTLNPLEKSVCCQQVVWEERNPAQCDVPLIYSVFEKAGIFGSTIVR